MAFVPLHVALGIVAGVDETILARLRAITRQEILTATGFDGGQAEALLELLIESHGEAASAIWLLLLKAWTSLRSDLVHDRAGTPALALSERDRLPDSLSEVPRELELPIELKTEPLRKAASGPRGDRAKLDAVALEVYPNGRPPELPPGEYRGALIKRLKEKKLTVPTDKTFRKYGH